MSFLCYAVFSAKSLLCQVSPLCPALFSSPPTHPANLLPGFRTKFATMRTGSNSPQSITHGGTNTHHPNLLVDIVSVLVLVTAVAVADSAPPRRTPRAARKATPKEYPPQLFFFSPLPVLSAAFRLSVSVVGPRLGQSKQPCCGIIAVSAVVGNGVLCFGGSCMLTLLVYLCRLDVLTFGRFIDLDDFRLFCPFCLASRSPPPVCALDSRVNVGYTRLT